MKVILNENQMNRLILEFLGSGWLNGAYLIENEIIGNWIVTIEARFHFIKFKNLDNNTTVTFKDDIADYIIGSITRLWNKLDISVEDAITIWIRRHKDALEEEK